MTITEDIISVVKKGKVIATKGTDVEIISEHGEVLIVKDKKGNMFSVLKTKVTTHLNQKD